MKAAAENSDSGTIVDSENSVENPAAGNFAATRILVESEIVVFDDNYSENFVDSLRQFLLQQHPLAAIDTCQLGVQFSNRFHIVLLQA